jgi:hypothetical protein
VRLALAISQVDQLLVAVLLRPAEDDRQ